MSDGADCEVRRLLNLYMRIHVFPDREEQEFANQDLDEAIANAIYHYCGKFLTVKEAYNTDGLSAEEQAADIIIGYLDRCGYEIRKKYEYDCD